MTVITATLPASFLSSLSWVAMSSSNGLNSRLKGWNELFNSIYKFAMLVNATKPKCVLSFICYPATCGPKGNGSGGATAEATAVGLLHDRVSLSQTDITGHSWAPLLSFSPAPPRANRTKEIKT